MGTSASSWHVDDSTSACADSCQDLYSLMTLDPISDAAGCAATTLRPPGTLRCAPQGPPRRRVANTCSATFPGKGQQHGVPRRWPGVSRFTGGRGEAVAVSARSVEEWGWAPVSVCPREAHADGHLVVRLPPSHPRFGAATVGDREGPWHHVARD